jgi:Holliday junction resolvase RusA-like endonuclease
MTELLNGIDETKRLWSCFVPGEPAARAEMIGRCGRFSRIIDKPDARNYKSYARMVIAQKAPETLFDCPLILHTHAFLTKPKSVPKKRTLPDRKPDLSNILKCIEDCLQGIVITDDSRIVEQHNFKYYADDLNLPGVIITLEAAK